jgi:predicted transcriptional regulator
MSENNEELVGLSAMIVAAYVAHNNVTRGDLVGLIESTHTALGRLGVEPAAEPLMPAVSIKKSITPDYLICLDDGKKFKSLKRHLRTQYDMTPEQYRTKWSLPPDYPMVAPAYAAARSVMAKSIGLGRKQAAAPVPPTKPKRATKAKA